jgi:lipopolysaccharide/colanic/teichoic acid biosynthesis glycosyltransferase
MTPSTPRRRDPSERTFARYDAAKRVADVGLSVLLLVLSFPLFVAIAVAVKLSSPGPVFYRGVRVGRFGRPFRQWKFRTMVVNAESIGGTKTCTLDERITGIGRRLRATKLDELPQLLNVIRGDMSLVGPRPMVPAEVERYTPFERMSLNVRPGVTDWASVWFHNEEHELSQAEDLHHYYETHIRPEKARLRVAYVRSRSFRVDASIVAQTAFVLFRTRLYPASNGEDKRPFRLWGHRPLRPDKVGARRAAIQYTASYVPPELTLPQDMGDHVPVGNLDRSSA